MPLEQLGKERLAQAYLPLVLKVAKNISRRLPSTISLDEVVSAGLLGLANAIKNFDAERANTFSSYAEFRIRGQILDDLRQRDALPREARSEVKMLLRVENELNARLGRKVEEEEIARVLGWSIEDIHRVRQHHPLLRQVPAEQLDQEMELAGPSPLESTLHKEQQSLMVAALERLPQKLQLVLWLFYYEELPVKDIAALLKVTAPRICQLRTAALEKLRHELHRQDLSALAA